jgi:pimeloyl-ACP methyl ester carboxylesterase
MENLRIVYLHGFLGAPDESHFLDSLSSNIWAPSLNEYIGQNKMDTLLSDIHKFDPHLLYGYSMGGRLMQQWITQSLPSSLRYIVFESSALFNLELEEREKREELDHNRAIQIKDNFHEFLDYWYSLPLWGNLDPKIKKEWIQKKFESLQNSKNELAHILEVMSPAKFLLPPIETWPQQLTYLYFYGSEDQKYKKLTQSQRMPSYIEQRECSDCGHNIHALYPEFIVQELKRLIPSPNCL